MSEDTREKVADLLVELAYALDDERLPMAARVAFVKRELGFAAKVLLSAAAIQNTAVDERMAAQNSESVDGYVQGADGVKGMS